MALNLLDPNSVRQIQKIVQVGETAERLLTGVLSAFKPRVVVDQQKFLPKDVTVSPYKESNFNNFISKVKGKSGFYKSSHFYVSIDRNPFAVDGSGYSFTGEGFSGLDNDYNPARDSIFACHRAILPGTNFTGTDNVKDFTVNGQVRRDVVTEYAYQNLNLSFYLDKKLNVKRYFESWANQVVSKHTHAINYYNSYVSDITIVMVDSNQDAALVARLKNCFPKQIQDVELDWTDNPTPKSLDVQFSFEKIEYYKTIDKTLIDANATDLKGVSTPDAFLKKLSDTGALGNLNSEVGQQLKEQYKQYVSQFEAAKGQIANKVDSFKNKATSVLPDKLF